VSLVQVVDNILLHMLLKLRRPFHVRIGIREDSDPTSFWRRDPSGIRKDSGYEELISSLIISYD